MRELSPHGLIVDTGTIYSWRTWIKSRVFILFYVSEQKHKFSWTYRYSTKYLSLGGSAGIPKNHECSLCLNIGFVSKATPITKTIIYIRNSECQMIVLIFSCVMGVWIFDALPHRNVLIIKLKSTENVYYSCLIYILYILCNGENSYHTHI